MSIEDHEPNVTSPETWEVPQIYPNLTASFRFRQNFGKTHFRLAMVLDPIIYSIKETPKERNTIAGYAASLTGNITLGEKDKLKFQAVCGIGFSGYLEDFNKLQTEATVSDGNLESINLLGGWLFLEHEWSDRWSSSMGYGLNDLGDNVRETEPSINQTHMGIVNLQYQPLDRWQLVLEGIYGERRNFKTPGTLDTNGHDLRFQVTSLFGF